LFDCLSIEFSRLRVASFVPQQRFFEGAKPGLESGQMTFTGLKQVHLAPELGIDSLDAEPLIAQLANASKLSKRPKIITGISVAIADRPYDSLFGPATDQSLAQAEQLLDFLDAVGRFDGLELSP
jgi:hypothetical protein